VPEHASNLTIRQQERANWCWVAVIQLLERWKTSSSRRQCEIAAAVLEHNLHNQVSCCEAQDCKISFSLQSALSSSGFQFDLMAIDALTTDSELQDVRRRVVTLLQAGTPVPMVRRNPPADNGTRGATNHAIVLTAYSPAGFVEEDPQATERDASQQWEGLLNKAYVRHNYVYLLRS
jgi:Papain-like cysteine protease AvrRpt2